MEHARSEARNYFCRRKKQENGRAKAVAGIAMLALLWLNGCAGLVMGSNSSTPPAGTPGTQPPGTTPQPQLSASPSSASFPNVASGSSSSQTITLLNSGTADATISNASVTGAGFSITGLT